MIRAAFVAFILSTVVAFAQFAPMVPQSYPPVAGKIGPMAPGGPYPMVPNIVGGSAPTPSYVFLGNSTTSNVGAAAYTFPLTMPGPAGLLVIYIGVQNQQTPTSLIYDPSGANITLHEDTLTNVSNTGGLWSGLVPAASGSKNVVLTASASLNFLFASNQAWLAKNLSSSSVQTAASDPNAVTSISVTTGQFMFGGCFTGSGAAGCQWIGATVAPNHINYDSVPRSAGADWIITSTNASFDPSAGLNSAQAYATYH